MNNIIKSILLLIVVAIAPSLVWAADNVGPVKGSFNAVYLSDEQGVCKSLLVTGLFIAPSPGYKVKLEKEEPSDRSLMLPLKITATAPSTPEIQVLTPIPVTLFDPNYKSCHSGASISYEKQTVLIGLRPALPTADR